LKIETDVLHVHPAPFIQKRRITTAIMVVFIHGWGW